MSEMMTKEQIEALIKLARSVGEFKQEIRGIALRRIPSPCIDFDDDDEIECSDVEEDVEWLASYYEDADILPLTMWGVYNMLRDVVYIASKYPRRFKEFAIESLIYELYDAAVKFKKNVDEIEPVVDIVTEARSLAERFVKTLEKSKKSIDIVRKYAEEGKKREYDEAYRMIVTYPVYDVGFYTAMLEDKLSKLLKEYDP